jgi:hypothetical protein
MLMSVAIDQRYRDFVAELASEADATSAVVCYTLELSTYPPPRALTMFLVPSLNSPGVGTVLNQETFLPPLFQP